MIASGKQRKVLGRTRWTHIALLALAISTSAAHAKDAVTPIPPIAPDLIPPKEPEARYVWCIALAKSKPDDGWEAALTWTGEGGGEPARHCAAVALIGLKQYAEAAVRLEQLAQQSQDEAPLRAGMLAQAGQAWILAGNIDRAYADQTTGLQLTPGAPDLLIDRSESLALTQNWKDALADLDAALKAAPNRTDALTFRATARRELGDLKGAAADAARAIALDPNYEDAWLESGSIKRLGGDKNGARHDWRKVLELAPGSQAGISARQNLEKLDLKE